MDQHRASIMGSPNVLRYGLLAKRLSRRSVRQDGITASIRASPADGRSSITSIGSVHSETTPLSNNIAAGIREEDHKTSQMEVLKEIVLGKLVSYLLIFAPFGKKHFAVLVVLFHVAFFLAGR